jgi:hypothetical protein
MVRLVEAQKQCAQENAGQVEKVARFTYVYKKIVPSENLTQRSSEGTESPLPSHEDRTAGLVSRKKPSSTAMLCYRERRQ